MSESRIPAALELLLKYGWTKGAFGYGDSPHCMSGALGEASTSSLVDFEFNRDIWVKDQAVLRDVIEERCGYDWGIVKFNDNPNTTWEDIEAVMKKAAEIREGEEI